ncbi:hypothetical protein COU24_00785 [Candidatus Kuenenbacteria bacterium CG10_big_fil_rev_8_21_14_0_10_39_14]|uniref:Nucleotidyl transferase AbiEii/AbiGii toxin family protein n=4 Tax=Candidatus Kueneniibacteriota TaxID=1752740 RepID=A0A2M7MGI3_9BACT|nr:hypothetical protein [Candidatus Kuenenbacteria bacterium]OIP56172.1 MAG: hypothetical protein AUK13_01565 [Candidatus Kuenenbacteria bacterium CG2_30_39_24]PIP75841.1 MAG: hypothetical protein COW86_01460 [Candidatus Kuenenbacteria bacterium CG22_combo_CG10-13_8_21_14_all_39_9]PIR81024.1 MAG: hypothetical protein COU24_00785 [Candidatus Kuenenbacteria bacterium CG10_big_fil_rev_8_21_14_0_10_39_14]PIX92190.1 MAG: hypothetical protein COZ26_03130 [Candidatus Kuenenbacteria bacterium CG_4_10_1
MTKIRLTPLQKDTLEFIGQNSFGLHFYWTGGTLLAYHYLSHRFSEDLDFFSEELFAADDYLIFLNLLKKALKLKKISYTLDKNRRLYLLENNQEKIKLELVYFPFLRIEKVARLPEFNLAIDSLTDIMVNKILSTYQRNEVKDIYDLYFYLSQKPKYNLAQLVKLVDKKFGVQIEPVLLLSKINVLIDSLKKLKPVLIQPSQNIDQEIKKFFQGIFNRLARKKIR